MSMDVDVDVDDISIFKTLNIETYLIRSEDSMPKKSKALTQTFYVKLVLILIDKTPPV